MKKLSIIIFISILASCCNTMHRHTIISNNYKDTSVIWAERFQYNSKGFATFYSEGERLTVYNINKIFVQ